MRSWIHDSAIRRDCSSFHNSENLKTDQNIPTLKELSNEN